MAWTFPIEYEFRVEGQEEVLSAINQVTGAQREFTEAESASTDATKEAGDALKVSSGSYLELGLSVGTMASGLVGLYSSFESIERMQYKIQRANLAVDSATITLHASQAKLAALEAEGVTSGDAYALAQERLARAQEVVTLATDRADMVQNNLTQSYVQFALSVLPTVSGMLTTYRAIEESVIGVKIASTMAQHGLNAAMLASPITIVVAVLAALIGALIYLYTTNEDVRNSLNAIGSAIYNFFKPAIDAAIAAVTALANGISWAAEKIGGAWNWLMERVGALAAAYVAASAKMLGMSDQTVDKIQAAAEEIRAAEAKELAVIEETTAKELAALEDKYNQMAKDADDAYASAYDAAVKGWMDQLNATATGFDMVRETYIDYYDDLKATAARSCEDQLMEIERAYTEQTRTIETSYDEQLAAANAYYDGLLAITSGKLSAIRDARASDLDALELVYLEQKIALEKELNDQLITQEDFQVKMDALEIDYRDKRGDLSDAYRVAELKAEMEDKENAAKVEEERVGAVAALKASEADELAAAEEAKNAKIIEARLLEKEAITKIEEEKVAKLAEIAASELELKIKHEDDLKAMEEAKRTEINAIVMKYEADRLKIVTDANAAILANMAATLEQTNVWGQTIGPIINGIKWPLDALGAVGKAGAVAAGAPGAGVMAGLGAGTTALPGMQYGGVVEKTGLAVGKMIFDGQVPGGSKLEINAPLINIGGSTTVDERILRQAVDQVMGVLKAGVIVEPTSSGASTSRIRQATKFQVG
jgi:hypothetical protein